MKGGGKVFKKYRNVANMTVEYAASKIPVHERTLINYESGSRIPGADVALRMADIYKAPDLTQQYCRKYCPIGQAFSYEILDNVNTDLPSIMMKLRSEMKEADNVLDEMQELGINKNSRGDFTDWEWKQLVKCIHEFMDVEHNIEILKIALGKWSDVSEIINQHNEKCIQRGYVKAS